MLSQAQHGIRLAYYAPLMRFVWLLGLAGCLLPPPVDETVIVENRAPRIEPQTLDPSPTLVPNSWRAACPEVDGRFGALITDEDGDTLYYRVFYDYFRGSIDRPNAQTPEPETIDLDPANKEASISFRPTPTAFASGNPHTVELFLADRPFLPGNQLPIGRRIEEGGKFDTFMWTILLDENTPCQ